MAYMDCESERQRKQFPPRDDGKKCGNCKHFKWLIACNGWKSGKCLKEIKFPGGFCFQYCDEHESA